MDTSNEDDYRPPVPPHRNSGTPQPQVLMPPRNSNKVSNSILSYNHKNGDKIFFLLMNSEFLIMCIVFFRFCQIPSCHLLAEVIPEITIKNMIATMTPNDLRKMADAQTGILYFLISNK